MTLKLCGTFKGREKSFLIERVDTQKTFYSVTLHLILGILNSACGGVKIILEYRKQLSTSMLIITTGLPFESASDAYLVTFVEVLLRYLLTFKPLINSHSLQTILQFPHACVGT